MPMAFCFEVKVQLSVPVHWRSPLARSSIRYLGVSVSSLRGGGHHVTSRVSPAFVVVV